MEWASPNRIENLGLQLKVGDELIAQKIWPSVKVACKKGRSKLFKLTFDVADLISANPVILPQYGAGNITFSPITEPNLVCVKKAPRSARGQSSSQPTAQSTSQTTGQYTYVLNTNTMKFHIDGCPSANRISDENKETRYGGRIAS